jgi:transcriptional regulator with XRE-family HTH domain
MTSSSHDDRSRSTTSQRRTARRRIESKRGEITKQVPLPGKVSPRFAQALKEARLARHWKQSVLAEHLGVPLRTLVSWETGMRLPPLGTVALLCLLLTDTVQVASPLFVAALEDDLQYQAARQSSLAQKKPMRREQIAHHLERIRQTVEFLHALQTGEQQMGREALSPPPLATPLLQAAASPGSEQMAQFFAVLERFRQAPELIPVVRDFLAALGQPPQLSASPSFPEA